MNYTYFIPEDDTAQFEAKSDNEALNVALSALKQTFSGKSYGQLLASLDSPLSCVIDKWGECKPEVRDDGCFPEPLSSASITLSYKDIVVEDGTHEVKLSAILIKDFDKEVKMVCANCGRIVSQGYVWDGTDVFCSDKCASQVLGDDTGCLEILVDDGRMEWKDKFEE